MSKHIRVGPGRVFAVLADGWSYAGWVVGASHIRDVDSSWPAPGSRIHHAIGPWPLVIRDSTVMTQLSPDRHLLMRVRLWPGGEADVDVRLEAEAGGTTVTMTETPVRGPLRLLGRAVDPLLHRRNTESLNRLAAIAERRSPTA